MHFFVLVFFCFGFFSVFVFGVFLTVVKIMHFCVCMLVHSLSYQSRKRRLAIRKAVRNRYHAINQEHADRVTSLGLVLGACETGGHEGEVSTCRVSGLQKEALFGCGWDLNAGGK